MSLPRGHSPENPFVTRDFYGPLETNSSIKLNSSDELLLKHPDDKSKLIRLPVGLFPTNPEIMQWIKNSRELFKNLNHFGISHVNPTYFDVSTKDIDAGEFGMVVDHIENATSVKEITGGNDITDTQFEEIDSTAKKIADYILYAVETGAIISDEILELHQFVYADSRKPGERCVLVDMEPLRCLPYSPETFQAIEIINNLTFDVGCLQALRPGKKMVCLDALLEAIDAVTNDLPEGGEEYRQDFLKQLAQSGAAN